MIGYNTMKKTHVQQEWDDIKIYYEQQQKKVQGTYQLHTEGHT